MSDKVKDISIKIDTYYIFDDIINIKNFHPNIIKIDDKSNKNILIYCIGYVTIKYLKYVKINDAKKILYTLFSVNWMDSVKKLIIISIWRFLLLMKAKK